VSFTTSVTEMPENNGTTVVTATLSNAKLEPTSVSLSLEGTSTTLIDYNVSAIYEYSSFAGKNDDYGSRDGVGDQARFSRLQSITDYLDGSFLVADRDAHVIKRVSSDGTVSAFLGRDYNCDGGWNSGDASERGICDPLAIAADLSNGNVFWIKERNIMGYNASDNQISMVYDGGNDNIGWLGGIAVLNSEIYFSDRERHVIYKLSWNGSGFDKSVVAGQMNQSKDWWMYDENSVNSVSASDPSLWYPTHLTADPANNKIYVGTGMRDWNNNWSLRAHVQVLDLNNSSVSSLRNTALYYANSIGYMPFGKVAVGSDGKVYLPSDYGIVAVVDFTETGEDYVAQTINNENFREPYSALIKGNSLYVTNQNSIAKIGLGASIDIPAGSATNNITLTAFKDVSFEEDETIDIKVGSISNGTSESNDIEVVTIIESTRLSKVDSPFIGVQNGKVSWGDYDRDGDMDLLLMGEAAEGTITNIYRNDGNDSDGNPVFENTNQNFTKYKGGDIEFVDVDQDGWLDVAVTGVSPDGRKSELYMNQEGVFFELNTNYVVEGLSQSDMQWADLDNDSDQDLIITGIDKENRNQALYYTNLGNFNFFKEDYLESI